MALCVPVLVTAQLTVAQSATRDLCLPPSLIFIPFFLFFPLSFLSARRLRNALLHTSSYIDPLKTLLVYSQPLRSLLVWLARCLVLSNQSSLPPPSPRSFYAQTGQSGPIGQSGGRGHTWGGAEAERRRGRMCRETDGLGLYRGLTASPKLLRRREKEGENDWCVHLR